MKGKPVLLVSLVLTGCTVASTAVLAYEEMIVENGGTVTGRVTFSGETPAPASFELWR